MGQLACVSDHDRVVGRQSTSRKEDFDAVLSAPFRETTPEKRVGGNAARRRYQLRSVHRSQLGKRLEQLIDNRTFKGRREVTNCRRWSAITGSGADEVVVANPANRRRLEARK
jgi:hypothetical protein